jgi:hypothetical protein
MTIGYQVGLGARPLVAAADDDADDEDDAGRGVSFFLRTFDLGTGYSYRWPRERGGVRLA